MYKTILLSISLAACTLPESSVESASESSCDYNQSCPDAPPVPPDECPPPTNGPTCEVDGIVVALDIQPANVDNNDGKVTFCHATSSASNPFVIITTSTSACTAHEDHEHLPQGGEDDVFGTDGCED